MSIDIDIVIPTYNRAHTLKRALDSITLQTVYPSTLWIIDDGSTDSTKKVIEEFKTQNSRIDTRYIFSENKGVSHARNLGIKCSNADWIAFLDSDDEWLPKKLELQSDLIQATPGLQVLHGEEIWIRNGVRVNAHKKHQKSGGNIFGKCLPLCCISPSAAMITRTLLVEMNGFREDYPVCEDYDLWLRICAKHAVGFIETPIIKKYGGHDDQISHKYFAMDFWRVRSISDLLNNNLVPKYHVAHAQNILRQKCEVLLKGYLKHQNLKDFDSVQEILKGLNTRQGMNFDTCAEKPHLTLCTTR